MTTASSSTALQTVERFLDHIFRGETAQAMALVAPQAVFVGARPEGHARIAFQGRFTGPEGAQRFFTAFGEALEPGEFEITGRFGEGEHAALYGRLRHRSRATGRDFASDWALVCRVREGQLHFYHFYEDTAALEIALGVAPEAATAA